MTGPSRTLAERHAEARERWLSLQAGPRHRERDAAWAEVERLARELRDAGSEVTPLKPEFVKNVDAYGVLETPVVEKKEGK